MSLAVGGAGAWRFVNHVANSPGNDLDVTTLAYTESKESRVAGFEDDRASQERCFIVKGGTDNIILNTFLDDLLGYARWDEGTTYTPGTSAFATPSPTSISFGTPSAGDAGSAIIITGPTGGPYQLRYTPVAIPGTINPFSSANELAALIDAIPGLSGAVIVSPNVAIAVTIEGTAPRSWSITGTSYYSAVNVTFSGGADFSSRKGLTRVLPDRHSNWRSWYCTKVRVEGFSVAGKTASVYPAAKWPYYRVWAYYGPVDYIVADDAAVRRDGVPKEYQRFCRFTPDDHQVEFLTLTAGMKFVTSHRMLSHPPARQHYTKIMTLEWLKVPSYGPNPFLPPNDRNDVQNRGTLNASTFLGYPRGTVLYLGQKPVQTLPPTSETRANMFYWRLPMQFAIKWNGKFSTAGEAIGHNYIWDNSTGRWDLITADGTVSGYRIYPETGNFYDLFQPG